MKHSIPRVSSLRLLAVVPVAIAMLLATAGVAPAVTHQASLDGAQEVPPVVTTATGTAKLDLNKLTKELRVVLTLNGLNNQTAAHIHGPAPPGQNAGVLLPLPLGDFDQVFNIDQATLDAIQNGLAYINIHTTAHPGGEIRGQIVDQPLSVDESSWAAIKNLYR